MPEVKAFIFNLNLIDSYASEFDVVILRVTLCFVLYSVLVPTKYFGYHSEKAPYQDLCVLQMASPILSKGKVRVTKIATFLGITMVSFSSFNFLAVTSNLLDALTTLEIPIRASPGGCCISIVNKFIQIKCYPKWHFFIFLFHFVHTLLKYWNTYIHIHSHKFLNCAINTAPACFEVTWNKSMWIGLFN